MITAKELFNERKAIKQKAVDREVELILKQLNEEKKTSFYVDFLLCNDIVTELRYRLFEYGYGVYTTNFLYGNQRTIDIVELDIFTYLWGWMFYRRKAK